MPKNLLVADDSVTIQKVVGIVFAHEDYRVIAAGSGEEAMRLAHEHRPDVVLADCGMAGMTGYDLCAAIKADPRLADVPVILLAGTSDPLDDARARSARADGHVVKPFDSQSLLSRVRELVEGVTPEPMPAAYPRTTPSAPSRPAPSFTPAPSNGPAPVAAHPSSPAGAPPRRAVPPPLPPPGHPSRVAAARPAGLPVPSVRTAGVRPPPPGAARPVASAPRAPSTPPAPAARPPAPPRPAPPPARPPPAAVGTPVPGPAEDDWSDLAATTPAPRPAIRLEPPAAEAAAPALAADGGEAALRLALSQASREVVERIAWEVIPQLAEVIIREHVERLVNERQKR